MPVWGRAGPKHPKDNRFSWVCGSACPPQGPCLWPGYPEARCPHDCPSTWVISPDGLVSCTLFSHPVRSLSPTVTLCSSIKGMSDTFLQNQLP